MSEHELIKKLSERLEAIEKVILADQEKEEALRRKKKEEKKKKLDSALQLRFDGWVDDQRRYFRGHLENVNEAACPKCKEPSQEFYKEKNGTILCRECAIIYAIETPKRISWY